MEDIDNAINLHLNTLKFIVWLKTVGRVSSESHAYVHARFEKQNKL